MAREIKTLIAILLIVFLTAGCSLLKKKLQTVTPTVSTGKKISIPKHILNNKFGFLSGHPGSEKEIKEMGGLWGRPHVGPFVWDAMQKKKTDEISFKQTDFFVQNAQESGLGMLATIFPFADWDQKTKPDAENYKVSDTDEFLPANWKKDKPPEGEKDKPPEEPMDEVQQQYLPEYRSNPADWKAYEEWLTALVERYDGDGKSDMDRLNIPVKYWEVMNEPDLFDPQDALEKESSLCFYKQGPAEYAQLLIETNKIIKKADPEAKVLIAGAAGGNENFLNFYREVFKNKEAISAFDIGNVHCISNDSYQSFNVEPYKKMLAEFGLGDLPVWVTEAEAMISEDADINASQTYESTKKALKLGAERIFFTRFDFENMGKGAPPLPPGQSSSLPSVNVKGSDPVETYKKITALD